MLRVIKIDWSDYICKSQICNINNNTFLDGMLEKYSDIFYVLVKINVPSETKPMFYKARLVSYAIKEKIENE